MIRNQKIVSSILLALSLSLNDTFSLFLSQLSHFDKVNCHIREDHVAKTEQIVVNSQWGTVAPSPAVHKELSPDNQGEWTREVDSSSVESWSDKTLAGM